MTSTLLINASPYGRDSRAYRIALRIGNRLLSENIAATLLERDLSLPDTIVGRDYAEAIMGRHPHDAPAFSKSEL